MFDADGLKPDPDHSGWVKCWGVVRDFPWHLAGIHPTKEVAETQATSLGEDYKVHYGAHCLGTDKFIHGN